MAKIHFIYLDIDTGTYPGVNHGLASLSAALKGDGHLVSLHHLSTLESEERVAAKAVETEADVIGFSFATNQKKYVSRYSTAVYSKTQVLQIAGGIHATISPLDVLETGYISGVCIGEGEGPLRKLLECVDKRQDVKNISGFWWNSTGGVVCNAVSPLEPDIDNLPLPDYSVFNTDRIGSDSSGWVAVMLIRGCPYDCYYCCNHVLRNIYPNKRNYVRMPSPQRAVDIIKHSLTYYDKVSGINFADDMLVHKVRWLERFSKLYIENIGLPYTCNCRIEHLSDETLVILKESGCRTVYIGIESGNEWVRKNLLNRHHTNEQIVECFSRIKKYGISTFAFNIMGLPFETRDQMRETLLLNKRIEPTSGVVFYFYPYPGTALFNICKNFDLFDEDRERLSGYLERPAIKLTHCTQRECTREYNKLRLFLASSAVVNNLRFPKMFSKVLYFLFSLRADLGVSLITRNTTLKYKIRKLFYRYRFR